MLKFVFKGKKANSEADLILNLTLSRKSPVSKLSRQKRELNLFDKVKKSSKANLEYLI